MRGITDLASRFTYHPPSSEHIVELYQMARDSCMKAAEQLEQHLPDSREKSLAMTKLEEAMYWANACIARHQEEVPSGQS